VSKYIINLARYLLKIAPKLSVIRVFETANVCLEHTSERP